MLPRTNFHLVHLSDAIFPLDRNTAIPWKSNPLPCRRHANDTIQDKTVRVVYLVSQDRQVRPDFQQALEKAIRELQQWYGQQLDGPTFFLVATGISRGFTELDPNRLKTLLDAAKRPDPS